MRNKNEQSLGEVIKELLNTYNLDKKLDEVSLTSAWESIVGVSIAKHTTSLYIRNQKLFVSIDSSVIRNELLMAKSSLLNNLNNVVGKEVITDIILK